MKAAIIMLAVGIGACATVPIFEPREWNATLQGTAGHEEARATARAVTGPGNTAVAINLAGGMAGATHPWHIHSGTCATGGPIVGDPAAYPPLRPGSGGAAAATAALRVDLVPGQNYHVNVHHSPEQLATIVACGNLQ
jgi:superoxide dismutase, Cu-Zn family